MADIGRGLRTYLEAQSPVSTLVSARLYPDALPQDATMPAIVFTVISGVGEHHMTAAAPLTNAVVQIDCFDSTRFGANTVAEAVRCELQGYRGTMGTEAVTMCHMSNRFYDYGPPEYSDDEGLYRVMLEFNIYHTETVPTF